MDSIFELASEELERQTGWSLRVARGTLRVALNAGGLKPETLTLHQLRVVFEKVMPRELKLRGIGDPLAVCAAVIEAVRDVTEKEVSRDLDEVFRRLNGE